jgi:hypothetical protein
MERDHINPASAYRDHWLALLEKKGVGRPIDLQVIAVPGKRSHWSLDGDGIQA